MTTLKFMIRRPMWTGPICLTMPFGMPIMAPIWAEAIVQKVVTIFFALIAGPSPVSDKNVRMPHNGDHVSHGGLRHGDHRPVYSIVY